MYPKFFNEGQLMNIDNDDVGEEKHMEDVALEGIDVALWQQKHELWVVLLECRLQMLRH